MDIPCPYCGFINDILFTPQDEGVVNEICKNCEQAVLFTIEDYTAKDNILSLAERQYADII